MPKAIFYLLTGDYRGLEVWGFGRFSAASLGPQDMSPHKLSPDWGLLIRVVAYSGPLGLFGPCKFAGCI